MKQLYILSLILLKTIYIYPDNKYYEYLKKTDNCYFIENKGQWHPDVLFLYKAPVGNFWITKKGINMDLYIIQKNFDDLSNKDDNENNPSIKVSGHRVLIEFLQINTKHLDVEKNQKLVTYFNYFIGNDVRKHASNVGLYKEVIVKNIYKGVDVRYYFQDNQLRFDFIVNAYADPNIIKMQVNGAYKDYLDGSAVAFDTRFGVIRIDSLHVFQKNKNQIRHIGAKWLRENNLFTLQLEKYDKTIPLIIDPAILAWSTYLGGNAGHDIANDISVDANGCSYVTGYTVSNDYDITPGAYDVTYNNGRDVFVSKLNANATILLYSTFVGGNDNEEAFGITVDNTGNAYVVGGTGSNDFPVTSGVFQTSKKSSTDWFIFKLDNTGSALIYSTFIGGNSDEVAYDVAIDALNQAYIVGYTNSNDYPVGTSGYQTTNNGARDIAIFIMNANGTARVNGTLLGGNNDDYGYGIKLDALGNVYIVGYSTSNNYDITSGCFQNTNAGNEDVVISKLNNTLTNLLYSTYVGGSNRDIGWDIDIDNLNNIYITGETSSNNFPTSSGAFQTTYATNTDAFALKLNFDGTLGFSTYIGGSSVERGNAIDIDTYGTIFITGKTQSANLYITPDAFNPILTSPPDVWLIRLNPTGNQLLYSSYVGGTNDETAFGLFETNNGKEVYITGEVRSNDYPTTPGVIQNSHSSWFGGNKDLFVTKFCFTPAVEKLTPGNVLQVVNNGNPITPIQFKIYSADGLVISGLPPGVTYNYTSGILTISGTPITMGEYIVHIKPYNECDTTRVYAYINVRINNLESCAQNYTYDLCGGGNGILKPNTNIASGTKYWWSGTSTTINGVDFNGGTLVVCEGNLNIGWGNFNSGTIIVLPTATLSLPYSTLNNCTIYNYGEIYFTSAWTSCQPCFIHNNPYGKIVCTGNLVLNNNSTIINKDTVIVNGNLVIQTNSSPAICKSNCSVTKVNGDFTNNYNNTVSASSGCDCLWILGNSITLNNVLTNSSNLNVCDAPGGTVINPSNWGSASVTSNCSGGCSQVLPIELLEFTANPRDNYVELYWKTATQINNDYFVVEKSIDAQNWQQLVIVKGAGTSYVPLEYLGIDSQPYEGINYYRLKQVDFDGTYSYSKIIAVKYSRNVATTNGEPILFPNPVGAGENLNIQFPANYMEVLVVLRDMMGREVFSKAIVFEENNLLYAIPLDKELPSGMYFVTASSHRNLLFSKKIIIK